MISADDVFQWRNVKRAGKSDLNVIKNADLFIEIGILVSEPL